VTKYRVRWWTGPTCVGHYAAHIAKHCPHFTDVLDGTEHIYFTIEARDEYDARNMIETAIGKSFCRVEEL